MLRYLFAVLVFLTINSSCQKKQDPKNSLIEDSSLKIPVKEKRKSSPENKNLKFWPSLIESTSLTTKDKKKIISIKKKYRYLLNDAKRNNNLTPSVRKQLNESKKVELTNYLSDKKYKEYIEYEKYWNSSRTK